MLEGMKASYPYYNPDVKYQLPKKEAVYTVLTTAQQGNSVELTYQGNGAKVVRANLFSTLNGGAPDQEWFPQ
ncbi:hypothetical protein SH580_01760 [Coraliomargarita algicola]|uniref:Uncharacterized protein n=1 Tax=Coraliomargarita algicola TaxID=3092156 RepID=A0ABZ0RND0_9BACT|nr:hypothetical protein [Coraliomargarita sp. J2-16]WPJ96427.1 hypothetical protein SH580_01760 [Coraliomargarita sp. J2-16]